MITHAENEFSILRYLKAERTFYCRWAGEVRSDLFKEVMTSKLEWLQVYNPKAWIIDMKYMLAIDVADQEWLMETWLVMLVHPFEKIAIIKPLDVYNEMVLENILDVKWGANVINVQFFSDFESSLAWIKEKG